MDVLLLAPESDDTLDGGSGYDECFGDFNDTFISCEVINVPPSVPWPLPGHPETMKKSYRRDYFHTGA